MVVMRDCTSPAQYILLEVDPGICVWGAILKSMLDLFDEVLQSSLFVRLQCFFTQSGVLLLN